MKVFVLCGGIGSRLEDYSFPKPLNMIYGKPAISYTLQKLPQEIKTVYFIYSPHLKKYNFEEIVINQFKDRNCIFLPLTYFTRGPVESAWCGIKSFKEEADDEPIVFLDNDVLYNFPSDLFQTKHTAFLGYSIDNSASEAFSFIQLHGDQVSMIKEKKRISNNFICGVYGFKSIRQFRDIAFKRLITPTDKELYLSTLFEDLLNDGQTIKGVRFPDNIYHIGSLKELKHATQQIVRPHMRICFDLDNTLVTYPSVPGDYSTVKPIDNMIQLVRKLHADGHTVIIHTARRMATHKNNVGAVIRDIGKQTFDTLDAFSIPYDEILFGKPIADIYIDDRAINPYRNDMESMGFIDYIEKVAPINKLDNNKYNSIELDGDVVVKRGPVEYLQGESYYYENLSPLLSISKFFPKYFGSKIVDNAAEIRTEYIRGIPIYTLYKAELLTRDHIKQLFEILDCLHNTKGDHIPSIEDVRSNYIDKLERRFSDTSVYSFTDTDKYKNICINGLKEYLNTTPTIVPYIHGDFWFSNILLDFKNNIKLIDMKGRLESTLTMGGDVMYDYGKLFQSIIGYDLVLNNDTVSEEYKQQVNSYFFDEIRLRGINEKHLHIITFSLIIGALHAIDSKETRANVWHWLTTTFDSLV